MHQTGNRELGKKGGLFVEYADAAAQMKSRSGIASKEGRRPNALNQQDSQQNSLKSPFVIDESEQDEYLSNEDEGKTFFLKNESTEHLLVGSEEIKKEEPSRNNPFSEAYASELLRKKPKMAAIISDGRNRKPPAETRLMLKDQKFDQMTTVDQIEFLRNQSEMLKKANRRLTVPN